MALTPKQETFCLAYVESGCASTAYRRAYATENMKQGTINRNAKREADKDKNRARIAELQEAHQNRHNVTVDSLVTELETDRRLARGNDQAGAAVTATMNIARLHGLVDRTPPINFTLPEITDAASALTAMSAVIQAMATGRLAPDEARIISGQIELYRRTLDTGEHERRMLEIERRLESEEKF